MSKFEKRQQAVGNGSHGLVIGGGIAGLLAAKVLLNHFESVTIVERDRLSEQPGTRPGVAQTVHSHGLLKLGSNILEQLFPGLQAELVAAGAILADPIADTLVISKQDAYPRCASDLTLPYCSRSLLEWLIRRRLYQSDRLEFLDFTQVIKLLTDETNSKITGLQLRDRDTLQQEELTANLIVDASGRQSSAPKWLDELGYSAPAETKVDAHFGYTTRWYERPQQLDIDWKRLGVFGHHPHNSRSGVLIEVEGDLWTLSLYGYNRDYAPTDEAGFLEFARSLSNPIIYEVIKDAKPISPIYSYRNTQNRLRHYERLKLPEGFVVMGDAAFAFNPFYGRGMTAAAMGALELDRCLARQFRSRADLVGLSDRFQKQLAHTLQIPWRRATNSDRIWLLPREEKTAKKLNWIEGFSQRYWQEFEVLRKTNPKIYHNMMEVHHMVRTSTFIYRLRFPWNIAKQICQRKIANYIRSIQTEKSSTSRSSS